MDRHSLQWTDERLAARLRILLADAGISITEAAEAIEVPYRTLQNQLAGRNRMPASTFAKLTSMLEVTPDFVATGRLRLNRTSFANALMQVLREQLPAVDKEYVFHLPETPDARTEAQRLQDARALTFMVLDRYEHEQGFNRFPRYDVGTALERTDTEGPQ